MKKNLLKSLLIALSMVFGVSAADAQTEIFKWDNANKATDYVAEVGTIECLAGNENGARLNYKNIALGVDYMTICLNGKQADLGKTDTSNGTYMKVTPTKALKAGDVISVTAFRNKDATGKKASAIFLLDNSKSFVLGADPEFPNLNEKGENPTGTPATLTHVVTEEEAGATTFNMTRKDASTNLFITSLVITTEEEKPIVAYGTKSTEPIALEGDKTYLVDYVQDVEFYTFQSAYDCQVTITPDVMMNLMVTKANFVMDENGYNEDYEDEKTFKVIGGGFGPLKLDELDDPYGPGPQLLPTYTWTAKAGVKYYVVAMPNGEGSFTVTLGEPVIPAQGTVIENPIDLSKTSVTWDVEKNPLDGDSFYTYTAPKDGEVTITFKGWITEELYVGEGGFFDPFTLPEGPEYQGEISGKCDYANAISTFTFAVEEGVTYCITPGYMYVYDEAKPITVSAKFTIPGVYGQLIEEMDAIDERLKALDKEFDADKRAELKLTEMWARIQDQIYYENRFLENDMINVEKPTNLQLALHKTRIAMINVAINAFETAAHIHANKAEIMKNIYEALLNLISGRDNMAAQYSIPADDAQWNSICARIDAQERVVNALDAAEGEPSAEEVAACEAEMSSIEAAMEAFAAKMESGATAIQSATATANDANIYNVAGQKTSANYRGIVIKNGKKMMVK